MQHSDSLTTGIYFVNYGDIDHIDIVSLNLNLSVTLLTDVVVRLRDVLVGNRKESIDTWHICCIINL